MHDVYGQCLMKVPYCVTPNATPVIKVILDILFLFNAALVFSCFFSPLQNLHTRIMNNMNVFPRVIFFWNAIFSFQHLK